MHDPGQQDHEMKYLMASADKVKPVRPPSLGDLLPILLYKSGNTECGLLEMRKQRRQAR